jgi:hypothetical protein
MLGAEVEANINITADDVLEAHRDRLKKAGELGFAVSQEEVPFDTGFLHGSGFAPEFRDGGNTLVFGYTAEYAEAMEEGTEPFTPPLEPLLRWGDRNFGTDRSADDVLQDLDENGWHPGIFSHPGAAVWSKIRAKGIEAQPYLEPAAERMEDYLNNHVLDL